MDTFSQILRAKCAALCCFLTLVGCAGDFSPELEATPGTTGTVQGSSSSTGGSGSDSGSPGGHSASGSSGGDSGSSDGDSGSSGGDSGSSSDGSGTSGGLPENPGPGDECDPYLAAQGIEPCITPTGSPQTFTCGVAVVDQGPAPDFSVIYGYRCMALSDSGLNGTDLGDYCTVEGGDWRPAANPPTSGCDNSFCVRKFSQPTDPTAGQTILPDGMCPTNGDQPGTTACCTQLCEPGGTPTCGSGMKCVSWGIPPSSLEGGSPPFGVCVVDTFDPNAP